MQIYWVILILLAGASQASGQANPADELLEGGVPIIEDKIASLPTPTIPPVDLGSLIVQIDEFERNDKFNEAILLNEQLLKLMPNSPEVFNNLARLHSINQDYDKAIKVLESGIATNETFETMHQNLRRLYLELARQVYQEALNEPNSNSSTARKKDTPTLKLVHLKIPFQEIEITSTADETESSPTPLTIENEILSQEDVVDIVIPVIESESLPSVKEIIFTDDAYDFPSANNDSNQLRLKHSVSFISSGLTNWFKHSNEISA